MLNRACRTAVIVFGNLDDVAWRSASNSFSTIPASARASFRDGVQASFAMIKAPC